MTDKEFREIEVSIDANELDRAWVDQPLHFLRASTALADARKEMDEAKNGWDLLQAELSKAIRQDPVEYGIEKITEAQVASTTIMQSEYAQAQRDFLNAKHKVDIYGALVGALDQKKRALEKLVDLHGQQYFSRPNAPVTQREVMEEVVRRDVRTRGLEKQKKLKK